MIWLEHRQANEGPRNFNCLSKTWCVLEGSKRPGRLVEITFCNISGISRTSWRRVETNVDKCYSKCWICIIAFTGTGAGRLEISPWFLLALAQNHEARRQRKLAEINCSPEVFALMSRAPGGEFMLEKRPEPRTVTPLGDIWSGFIFLRPDILYSKDLPASQVSLSSTRTITLQRGFLIHGRRAGDFSFFGKCKLMYLKSHVFPVPALRVRITRVKSCFAFAWADPDFL